MNQLEAYEYLDKLLLKINLQEPVNDGDEIVAMYPDKLEILALKKIVSEGYIEPLKEENIKLFLQYVITFEGLTFEGYAPRFLRQNHDKRIARRNEKLIVVTGIWIAALTALLLILEFSKWVCANP